jgi:hypothetical protein
MWILRFETPCFVPSKMSHLLMFAADTFIRMINKEDQRSKTTISIVDTFVKSASMASSITPVAIAVCVHRSVQHRLPRSPPYLSSHQDDLSGHHKLPGQ